MEVVSEDYRVIGNRWNFNLLLVGFQGVATLTIAVVMGILSFSLRTRISKKTYRKEVNHVLEDFNKNIENDLKIKIPNHFTEYTIQMADLISQDFFFEIRDRLSVIIKRYEIGEVQEALNRTETLIREFNEQVTIKSNVFLRIKNSINGNKKKSKSS